MPRAFDCQLRPVGSNPRADFTGSNLDRSAAAESVRAMRRTAFPTGTGGDRLRLRHCRGGDHAEARDGEPATSFALGMPGGELLVEDCNLAAADRHDLADQYLQSGSSVGWQRILVGKRLLGEPRKMGDTGVGDEAQLRQMPAHGIGQHGVLAHEQGSGAMSHEHTLLLHHLPGTNRIVGRWTASQIASASSASLLLRLT